MIIVIKHYQYLWLCITIITQCYKQMISMCMMHYRHGHHRKCYRTNLSNMHSSQLPDCLICCYLAFRSTRWGLPTTPLYLLSPYRWDRLSRSITLSVKRRWYWGEGVQGQGWVLLFNLCPRLRAGCLIFSGGGSVNVKEEKRLAQCQTWRRLTQEQANHLYPKRRLITVRALAWAATISFALLAFFFVVFVFHELKI